MEESLTIQRYLAAVPKAELHVHLEGSIRPQTLLELARRNKVTLPFSTLEEVQQWFTFRDFAHFIQLYSTASHCLKTAEDYELIVYEFGEEMVHQNMRYAEVTFTASMHDALGVAHDTYFNGLNRGRELARRDFGVEIRWVFDIARSIQDEAQRRRLADFTTRVAIECMHDGVVALGLGGGEAGHPPEYFAPWFERALSAGLHSTPHAGEGAGPASIWGALHRLGAERIGHGVRSIEDPALIKHLAQRCIPLEICPGSNICLGIYPSFSAHPLPRLYAASQAHCYTSNCLALKKRVCLRRSKDNADLHKLVSRQGPPTLAILQVRSIIKSVHITIARIGVNLPKIRNPKIRILLVLAIMNRGSS